MARKSTKGRRVQTVMEPKNIKVRTRMGIYVEQPNPKYGKVMKQITHKK